MRAMAARILVCDDEASLREMLGVLLRRAGYETELVSDVTTARARVATATPYDLVITDLALPDGTGMDVLAAARERDDALQVVVITAFGSTENAVQAMRLGAYDYIQKPFRNHELLVLLEKALEKRKLASENRVLRARVAEQEKPVPGLLGSSPAMRRVMDLVRRVAGARTSVLITGESGTGKEMVARALHQLGERASGPFIVVNCGALPEALMESELFGHEKGAFTGATQRNEGLFRAAESGTLFLDEIGELAPALQVKLLRVLQERKVRPVGGQREIETDVRVVAATNRDLEKEVAEGRFRSDLFYRLNVIRLQLPPLRERPEDVPALAEHFLQKHASLAGKTLRYSPAAMRWLAAHDYPGNVRELENVVERAVTLALGEEVTLDDLPEGGPQVGKATTLPSADIAPGFDIDRWLGELEKGLLLRALEQTKGNQTAAARLLGTTFRSFRYRLRKFGLAEGDSSDDEK
ncbi:Response regulator of zinc sigma-54-dependent two-component system [Sandaracinus amylolyticus]|uniref:Response regulator of zinc sigma-54-dependent two-component system n=2 Tax=Sandaracinus amylolyticus TaxID=927083 RepID=A0A0F6W3Y4_9BACT|nr:Response regulator of zinc sigma-54-dependent two-component system [Sandaracinus amylolyticus]